MGNRAQAKIRLRTRKELWNLITCIKFKKAHILYDAGIKENLVSVPRTQQEAYEGNWNYRFSAKRNPQTPIFWKQFQQTNDWEELLGFFQPTFSEKCKLFVKKYCGPTIANKLRRILGK